MLSYEIFNRLSELRKLSERVSPKGKEKESQDPLKLYEELRNALPAEEDKRELDRFFKKDPLSEEEKKALQTELLQKIPNANLGYNLDVYLALLPYTKLMYSAEKNGIAEEHAYKLAVLLKPPKEDKTKHQRPPESRALDYLNAYLDSHPKSQQLIHDACNFALPQEKCDLDTWGELCAKHLLEDPFRKLILPQAASIEKLIKSSQKKVKPSAEAVKKATEEIQKINSLFQKLEEKHGDENFDKEVPDSVKKLIDEEKMINTLIKKIKKRHPKFDTEDIIEMDKMLRLLQAPAAGDNEKKYESLLTQLNQRQAALKRAPELTKLKYDLEKMLIKLERDDESKEEELEVEEQYQELSKHLFKKRLALAELGVKFDKELTYPMLMAFREKYISEASLAYKYFLDHGLTQKDYEKFSALERVDDDTKIPDIKIDGATFRHPGFYLMKVPVMNELHAARAACLGKLTNCCQSLSGEAGEPCAIHGLTNASSGFYVLCQGDINNPKVSDDLIGQCWAWRSKTNAIVFDSIESKNKSPQTIKVVSDLYRNLAKTLVEDNYTHKVATGASSGISSSVGIKSSSNLVEYFSDYTGYSDAKTQLVLYDKDKPFYWYNLDEKNTKATEEMIEIAFRSPLPLLKSTLFSTALYWALVDNRSDLITKMQEISKNKYPSRVEEFNKISEILQFISQYEKNSDSDLRDPLILAASVGRIDLISTLLEYGADINVKDNKGNTALILAAEKDRIEVVRMLAKRGSDVNAKNSQGNTALMLAIIGGSVKSALALIENGADIHISDNEGNTVLMLAAAYGHLNIVETLIKKGADINVKDNKGNTALKFAYTSSSLFHDNSPVVTLLIDKGADVNIKAKDDRYTLLHYAIERGLSSHAVNIIEKGVNIDIKFPYGDTPLIRSISEIGRYPDHKKVVMALIEHSADLNVTDREGNTALMQALIGGYFDIALLLIEKGSKIDIINNNNDTPWKKIITSASSSGNNEDFLNLVHAFIKRGVNINDKDKSGRTLLINAVGEGDFQLVQLILAQKPHLMATDENGNIALNYLDFSKPSSVEIALELISHGIDINTLDSGGNNLLMYLVMTKHFSEDSLVKFINAGITFDTQNAQGETTLLLSLKTWPRENKGAFILKLLELNANVNIKDSAENSPLYYALKNKHENISLELIKKGADVNAINKKGESILMMAAKMNLDNVVRELVRKGAKINEPNETAAFEGLLKNNPALQAALSKPGRPQPIVFSELHVKHSSSKKQEPERPIEQPKPIKKLPGAS